jgi:hypothetical protein
MMTSDRDTAATTRRLASSFSTTDVADAIKTLVAREDADEEEDFGSIADVGSSRWRRRRLAIHRLRARAFEDARDEEEHGNGDDSIRRPSTATALVRSSELMETLVVELARAETWRDECAPRMRAMSTPSSMTTTSYAIYLVRYHESVVCNLFELVLSGCSTSALDEVEDDVAAELADYCLRRIVWLSAREGGEKSDDDDDSASTTPDFTLSMSALAIARCLAASPRLLGQTRRDALAEALAPLLDSKPWIQRERHNSSIIKVYVDGSWTEDISEWDANTRVQKCEAQVWLALRSLLCDPAFAWDETRKSLAARVRKHLNESTMDQIPVLRDLKHVLDEVMVRNLDGVHVASRLAIEIVPKYRRALTQNGSAEYYESVAAIMLRERFDAIFMASIAEDILSTCEMTTDVAAKTTSAAPSSSSGDEAPVKIDILRERKTLDSASTSFDTVHVFEYDFAKDRAPNEVRAKTSHTRGLRRALASRSSNDGAEVELPCAFDGKIRVNFDARTITAPLTLRRSATTEDKPSVWITVGALAVDGFAAQLRLDRSPRGGDAYVVRDVHLTIAVTAAS